jgi:uncharacterized protein
MENRKETLNVAVVTGGHAFDVVGFHELFHSLPGINPIIQHMDDFATTPDSVRNVYDVIVLYHYLLDGPTDESLPWYSGKPRTVQERLGETSQGIVVLHHTVLAYPEWSLWNELVGIRDRSFSYHPDQRFEVKVASSNHPITQGLNTWTMTDETYRMVSAGEDSQILLTTDHADSLTSLAWTRQYKQSRVFCTTLGHDRSAWEEPCFRTLLGQGIHWCSG